MLVGVDVAVGDRGIGVNEKRSEVGVEEFDGVMAGITACVNGWRALHANRNRPKKIRPYFMVKRKTLFIRSLI